MRIYLSLLLLFATNINLFGQQPITSKASLQSVTVFNYGAELNHRASITLPTGSSEVVINNVANQLDENSIQVGVPVSVTIMSVRAATDYNNPENLSPEYLRTQDSLNTAKRVLETINNRIAAEESAIALLDKSQQVGSSATGVSVAEFEKLVTYYRSKYNELKNAITALKTEAAQQQRVVTKWQNQLNELNRDQSGTGGQLVLQLMNSQAGNADFNISYISPVAGWNAYYDLRADNLSSPLNIIYKANVWQRTGILWDKVKLTLSTGNPAQGGIAPVLNPWFLSYYNPNSTMIRGAAQAGVQNRLQTFESRVKMEDLEEVIAAAPAPSTIADYTTVSENQLSATFDIDIPYDIAPNGKMHSVSLQQFSHPANFKYYAAPRVDIDAFLLAEITDYETLNLIPGEANIIFENMYVGKTYIDPYATTDTLNLSMGRDKMISIKRERVAEQTSTQTISNNKRQTATYEIRIRNNKRTTVNMLLKDQYPISTDRTMQVELLESSNAAVNTETGVMTWKLSIPPGETQTIRISYAVRYPKDRVISNL